MFFKDTKSKKNKKARIAFLDRACLHLEIDEKKEAIHFSDCVVGELKKSLVTETEYRTVVGYICPRCSREFKNLRCWDADAVYTCSNCNMHMLKNNHMVICLDDGEGKIEGAIRV